MAALFPVGDIADWLHPRSSKHKALAMLYAYFDDSGTHEDSPITAIAGYVGSKQVWEEIEKKWLGILADYKDYGVEWFHMAECVAQQGQFATIDKPSRNYLIRQLSTLLGHPGLQGIRSAVVNDDWKAVVKDEAFLRKFPKPFGLCFNDIVYTLWEWSKRSADGERIALMFSQGHTSGIMSEIDRANQKKDWYSDILGPIAFGDPRQIVPLQAPDLLVYLINKDTERRAYGPHDLRSGGEMEALYLARGKEFQWGHWFGADGLEKTAKRYLDTGEIYSLE